MPGSSNTSFIPKHAPSKAERKSSPRQLFLGTLLVRILFFAVLFAAAATFFYERRLNNQLTVEVVNFNTAAGAYDADADKLKTVLTMDNRLRQAREVFAYNVPMSAIFESLEKATVANAQLTAVSIGREKPGEILLEANLKADTFDSTLFQRSIFTDNELLTNAFLEDVTLESAAEEGEDMVGSTDIVFKATVSIDPEDIPSLLTEDAAFVPVLPAVTEVGTTTNSDASTTDAADVEVGFSNE